MRDVSYGARKELPGVDYEDAIARVEAALGEEGFGILTRIDVKGTLKKKLDEDFKRYVILGACNPHLAHRALTAEESIGLLLPCNVVVAETPGGSEVAYARPEAMLSLADLPEVEPVAREAEERLARALERL
ncbi:MAG TPA: DUF302 domain-containing protein [Gemmatimonadota bacterium]|nr:DUF302 domain-containing protein [Gemmatimonadota bacterium]